MAHPGRKATVLLAAALAMTEAGQASAEDEATIVLHVANYAAVSRDVLDAAKARSAKVYEVIGVRIQWADGEPTVRRHEHDRLHLTVILLSREMAQKKISTEGIADDVLGQAHLPSGRANIFCDRIATMPGAPTFLAIPLGDVIAHEVGHLILSTSRHSPRGIMRASMDVHGMRLQGFDKIQSQTIRRTLTEGMAGVTRW